MKFEINKKRLILIISGICMCISAMMFSMIYPTHAEESISMYRLYNPNTGEHLYSSSRDEVNMLLPLGWQYEGIAWQAPLTSNTPVYRLYNSNSGDHHYTMNQEEIDWLTGLGWTYEGIAWYSGGNTPIYRLFNPSTATATHHYTAFDSEKSWLLDLGWQDEQIAWYAVSTADTEQYYDPAGNAVWNGLAANSEGLWKITNGCIDYSYTGQYVLYEASIYNYDSSTKVYITNGKATEFNRVFIGDSRTDCMAWSGETDDGYICKRAMEYDYFTDTEIPELENLLHIMPGIRSVVINMGANDILHSTAASSGIAEKYSASINELIQKYPTVKFYFASIYYVDYPYEEGVTWENVADINMRIDEYNLLMKENCNAAYIPLQEYLTENGFKTDDGLHIYNSRPLRDYIVQITG